MAQLSRVFQADPWKLAQDLNNIALTEEVQIVVKTHYAGKFIAVSDDAGGVGQSAVVIVGDPDKLSKEVQDLIDAGHTIDVAVQTFSSAHYVVVYR
jgi:hypothetical protein